MPITKTPVPIKKSKSTVDDLLARFSATVDGSVDAVQATIQARSQAYRQRLVTKLSSPSCEICKATGTSAFRAKCGHQTWLCPACARDCKVALEWCDRCEEKRISKQLAALEAASEPTLLERLEKACE